MAADPSGAINYPELIATAVNFVSLVIGVTSLVLAWFAIWLSWQFYKQSQMQNDRVQDAVGRIEKFVTEMHGNVNNIVQKAVAAWTDTAVPSEQEVAAGHIITSLDELRGKVDDLEKTKDPTLKRELMSMIEDNQNRTEALLSSIREARIRSVFTDPGNDRDIAAVRVIHHPQVGAGEAEAGQIVLDVQRESSVITGTVHLLKVSGEGAQATVSLVSCPENSPSIKLRAGFSTGDMFNVHLHAPLGEHLRVGRYTVDYKVDAKAG